MTYIRHKYDIEKPNTGGSTLGNTLLKDSSLMVVNEFSREFKSALGHRKKRP